MFTSAAATWQPLQFPNFTLNYKTTWSGRLLNCHGQLLENDNTLPTGGQVEANISDFPPPPWNLESPENSHFWNCGQTHIFASFVNRYEWKNVTHIDICYPSTLLTGSLAWVTPYVACERFAKNLLDTRNLFTFGYVEVQRLYAMADTAAFALALF